jgi:ABC-type uncharacterized transport system auxiliary subunit
LIIILTKIGFFIKRCAWFLWDNPRILIVGLAVLLLLVVGLQMKGCFRAKPKFNEAEIFRANQAVETQNRKEMEEVLVQSEVREKAIDGNVVNAKKDTINAYADARKKYAEMTPEQLQAEINEKLK